MYKLFKEEDGYDPLIDIYSYPELIQLKYFPGHVQHCVTVVGRWIFDSNFLFHFLSLKTIFTTSALMKTKQK